MNVFAKFDEIPSMILQDIKGKKRFGHQSDRRSEGWTGNLKTVYPSTNTVCGGVQGWYTAVLLWCGMYHGTLVHTAVF